MLNAGGIFSCIFQSAQCLFAFLGTIKVYVSAVIIDNVGFVVVLWTKYEYYKFKSKMVRYVNV